MGSSGSKYFWALTSVAISNTVNTASIFIMMSFPFVGGPAKECRAIVNISR